MSTYDVVIIGAGPGGYVAAIRAAQVGLKAAVVEKTAAPGGTCLHWGCIPTKSLLHSAAFLSRCRHAERDGLTLGSVELNLAGVMKRKDSVVRRLTGGVSGLLKQNGVTLVTGTASLAGNGTVSVSGGDGPRELTARHIVLAAGSEPAPLPSLPFDGQRIVSSNEAIAFSAVPRSLLVVGGGAVGLELAVVWSRFGSTVTLVELMPHVLPGGDPELSHELAKALKKQGIAISTETTVTGARVSGSGVTVSLQSADGADQEATYEAVLVAVGRRAVLNDLGLDRVGITPERGRVPVDELGRTRVPTIFAIGDMVPGPQLAHLASMEGIVAIDAIAGRNPVPINRRAVPACTYTDPEAACVGLTEQNAAERGYEVTVARFPFMASGKALVEGDQTGWVKLVADRTTDQVLGAHIVGPQATELIAEATLAVQMECTCEELARTIHSHPTLSEVVGEAAHAAHEGAIHFFTPR